mmetsp:Transcript_25723/g.65388  ORF Transcript_25723/g.65388 Transcript_25723/m.65388 type:complete len:200 (-) Transcript_25723:380-979(-)
MCCLCRIHRLQLLGSYIQAVLQRYHAGRQLVRDPIDLALAEDRTLHQSIEKCIQHVGLHVTRLLLRIWSAHFWGAHVTRASHTRISHAHDTFAPASRIIRGVRGCARLRAMHHGNGPTRGSWTWRGDVAFGLARPFKSSLPRQHHRRNLCSALFLGERLIRADIAPRRGNHCHVSAYLQGRCCSCRRSGCAAQVCSAEG